MYHRNYLFAETKCPVETDVVGTYGTPLQHGIIFSTNSRSLKETFANYAGKTESFDFQFEISHRLTVFPADISLLRKPHNKKNKFVSFIQLYL
jgi:hypothetical protein